MSLLSSALANRQFVLLCARLLVNCAIGWWSIPQTSMDELPCLGGSESASRRSITWSEPKPIAPRFNNVSAGLRQTRPQCQPSS
jgi:hypothetical protein